MKKHPISVLLLCLVAGCLLNIAVAIGATIVMQSTSGQVTDLRQNDHEQLVELSRRYHHPTAPAARTWRHWGARMESIAYDELYFLSQARIDVDKSTPYEWIKVIHIKAGWPWTSFQTHERHDLSFGQWQAEHMLNLARTRQPQVASADVDGFVIPMSPVWRGLVINSLFYAVLLWMVFLLPYLARRSMRLRRGLCPACAYPIGISERCTECGQMIPR